MIVLGLDNAGKTTVLQQLSCDDITAVTPTHVRGCFLLRVCCVLRGAVRAHIRVRHHLMMTGHTHIYFARKYGEKTGLHRAHARARVAAPARLGCRRPARAAAVLVMHNKTDKTVRLRCCEHARSLCV